MTITSPMFGPIFVASNLEQAVLDSLKEWFPTYLREVERQSGLTVGEHRPPVNYSNRNSFDVLAGEAMPKVVCISPGTIGNPEVYQRTYSFNWAVGVGIVVAARSEGLANQQVKVYGAAARAIVEQQFIKAKLVLGVQFIAENYEDIRVVNQNQHCRAAGIYFTMDVPNIVTKGGMGIGPDTPDDDPYEYGQAETVIVDLERMEE